MWPHSAVYITCNGCCRVPTYDEVVGSEDEGQLDDSEDEEALEEQEDFERKFNFRFEEPGGELVRPG